MTRRTRNVCLINATEQPEHLYTQNSSVFHSDNPDSDDSGEKFDFDSVYGPGIDQESLFDELLPAIEAALRERKSAYFLAHGPSCSGKTYTITGGSENFKQRGLIPRTLSYLLDNPGLSEYKLDVSFFEIYKGLCLDLLADDRKRVSLLEQNGGMVIDLSECTVEDETEAYQKLFVGDAHRHFSKSTRNPFASRGHSVFIITIHLPPKQNQPNQQSESGDKVVLYFIDLATPPPEEILTANPAPAVSAIIESNQAFQNVLEALVSGGTIQYEKNYLTMIMMSLLDDCDVSHCYNILVMDKVDSPQVKTSLRFAMLLKKAMKRHEKKVESGMSFSVEHSAEESAKSCEEVPASPHGSEQPANKATGLVAREEVPEVTGGRTSGQHQNTGQNRAQSQSSNKSTSPAPSAQQIQQTPAANRKDRSGSRGTGGKQSRKNSDDVGEDGKNGKTEVGASTGKRRHSNNSALINVNKFRKSMRTSLRATNLFNPASREISQRNSLVPPQNHLGVSSRVLQSVVPQNGNNPSLGNKASLGTKANLGGNQSSLGGKTASLCTKASLDNKQNLLSSAIKPGLLGTSLLKVSSIDDSASRSEGPRSGSGWFLPRTKTDESDTLSELEEFGSYEDSVKLAKSRIGRKSVTESKQAPSSSSNSVSSVAATIGGVPNIAPVGIIAPSATVAPGIAPPANNIRTPSVAPPTVQVGILQRSPYSSLKQNKNNSAHSSGTQSVAYPPNMRPSYINGNNLGNIKRAMQPQAEDAEDIGMNLQTAYRGQSSVPNPGAQKRSSSVQCQSTSSGGNHNSGNQGVNQKQFVTRLRESSKKTVSNGNNSTSEHSHDIMSLTHTLTDFAAKNKKSFRSTITNLNGSFIKGNVTPMMIPPGKLNTTFKPSENYYVTKNNLTVGPTHPSNLLSVSSSVQQPNVSQSVRPVSRKLLGENPGFYTPLVRSKQLPNDSIRRLNTTQFTAVREVLAEDCSASPSKDMLMSRKKRLSVPPPCVDITRPPSFITKLVNQPEGIDLQGAIVEGANSGNLVLANIAERRSRGEESYEAVKTQVQERVSSQHRSISPPKRDGYGVTRTATTVQPPATVVPRSRKASPVSVPKVIMSPSKTMSPSKCQLLRTTPAFSTSAVLGGSTVLGCLSPMPLKRGTNLLQGFQARNTAVGGMQPFNSMGSNAVKKITTVGFPGSISATNSMPTQPTGGVSMLGGGAVSSGSVNNPARQTEVNLSSAENSCSEEQSVPQIKTQSSVSRGTAIKTQPFQQPGNLANGQPSQASPLQSRAKGILTSTGVGQLGTTPLQQLANNKKKWGTRNTTLVCNPLMGKQSVVQASNANQTQGSSSNQNTNGNHYRNAQSPLSSSSSMQASRQTQPGVTIPAMNTIKLQSMDENLIDRKKLVTGTGTRGFVTPLLPPRRV